jgi:hypothetical protein
VVDIWYPASPAADAKPETYRAEFRGDISRTSKELCAPRG